MSVWTTKSLDKDCNYIVVKHKLRGINYQVNGIKFRDGYAVVEKDSKTYFALKKIPILRDMEEFPLLHLRKLKFITRSADVRTVYGQDVYRKYIEVLTAQVEEQQVETKQEEERVHIEESPKCKFRSENTNELCEFPYLEGSPSHFCKRHVLLDPKLSELGFTVPKIMSKNERRELRDKIADKLRTKNG